MINNIRKHSKLTMSIEGHNKLNGEFDWLNAVLDATLFAGATFFSGLTLLISQGMNLNGFVLLVSMSGTEFIGFLMLKRKLVSKK